MSGECTFIIPVYISEERQIKYLEDTIEGLFRQTDSYWNAVFINDCSPIKKANNIIKHYQKIDNRLNLIELNKRVSTGKCRNIGIEWASKRKSEFILYNDADDISHPKRVEYTRQIFKGNPDIGVVYSGIDVINENNNILNMDAISKPIKEILNSLERCPPIGEDSWLHIAFISGYTNVTSATSVRTNIALQEKFPDEYISEDLHTWYRYGVVTNFYYERNTPTQYRLPSYTTRQTSERYTLDFFEDKVRVDSAGFNMALKKYKSKKNLTLEECKLLKAKFLLRLSESIGYDEKYEFAFKIAMEAQENLKDLDFLE